MALAARVADTYLMWGEPPARDRGARRRRARPWPGGRCASACASTSSPATASAEARAAAAELLSRAEVAADRASEYAGFDSVGQARMNAIDADGDGWVAPGLWAGIRAVRGGAGTALVGSHAQVAELLGEYRRGRGRPRHRLRLPAPGGGRPGRHAGLAAADGRSGPRDPRRSIRGPRAGPPSWPSASARRSTRSTAPAWRPRRAPSWTVAGPDVTVAYSVKSNPLMGLVARLHRAGCWAEVASGFEYRVARRAGVPGRQIVFNGPLKTSAEIRRALGEGATVIADGPEQVREIARLAGHAAPGARVGLRLRPPDRERTDRFGVPARLAPAAAVRAGARRPAAHRPAHPPRRLPARAAAPDRPADPRRDRPVPGAGRALRRSPRRGCARRPSGSAASSGSTWAAAGRPRPASAPTSTPCARSSGPDAPPLVLEPGRALIRDAGWLLTRVVARRGRRRGGRRRRHHPGAVRALEALARRGGRAPPRRGAPHRPLRAAVPAARRDRARGAPAAAAGRRPGLGRARPAPTPWPRRRRSSTCAPARCWSRAGRAALLRARETDDEALGAQAEPLLVGPEGRAVSAS